MIPVEITKKISAISLLLSLLIACSNKHQTYFNLDKMQEAFSSPNNKNRLWCYWYWIGDDISKEGITKDLEAMKEVGIGAALIGNINPKEKDGKVPMLSEFWWEHMVHAINEGKRIGVDIGVFNCPGWSQSGGPWIKPNMAMRYMTYSEAEVEGGNVIKLQLAKPTKEFQDTYVLAFPTIEAEQRVISSGNSKITVSPNIENEISLIDRDTSTVATFSGEVTNYHIEITTNKSIKANSIKIIPGKKIIDVTCDVYAKINNKLTPLKSFHISRSKLDPNVGPDKYALILIDLPDVNSDYFELVFKKPTSLQNINNKTTWDISEIIISEASGLEYFAEKNLSKMHPTPTPNWDSYIWNRQPEITNINEKINPNSIIDISNKMDENGNLLWDAPKGSWTIQRYGMTPTGTKNAPAAPQGKGYEVDKANKKLVQYHYNQFIGELLKRLPEESKSAFKYVIADSYEMGSQNWTDGFEQTFEAKFGYNPKPYLPVFTGRVVGSVEESERFLWDIRRFVADAVAYEYVGGLRESSNKDGMKLWLENYGHWGFPSEFLMYGGQSDLVSGEFWNEGPLGNIECKSASSAAHIYGKPVVSAEAFTAASRTYVRHPAMLKKRGDWSYTQGINHFVLHLYIHQPDDNRVPGINAWFSTEFNRHNTWFKKGKAYFDYLRRCQYLLQQGNYAADVCYFIGENVPIMSGATQPELPDGYSFDYINAEVILNRLTVKNGKFVLPDGMSYSLMVLPPFDSMRPELLNKIESLVAQGGKIFGQAPTKSPSLQNYPASDETVKQLANKMWGDTNHTLKPYGKGYIADGLSLEDALNQLHIQKDVNINTKDSVLWTHRTLPNMEIYFLTNQSDKEVTISPSFRVQGMKPYLWDAMTGNIRPLNQFEEKNQRTTVPITMQAYQSWFVVFSKEKISNKNSFSKNFPKAKVVDTIKTTWNIDFLNKAIGPKEPVNFSTLSDWSINDNSKIKYYSGNANYSASFNYRKNNNAKSIYLDLGKVGVMASVKLNGIDLGTTWMAPYEIDVSNAIINGKNNIEIEVVNVWRNRLTGDKTLAEDEKTTWIIADKTTPKESLISSGLLGPVTIKEIIED